MSKTLQIDTGGIKMSNTMPIGFSFALGTNDQALAKFGEMTEEEKKQVIEAARATQSKQEMRSLVEQIANLK